MLPLYVVLGAMDNVAMVHNLAANTRFSALTYEALLTEGDGKGRVLIFLPVRCYPWGMFYKVTPPTIIYDIVPQGLSIRGGAAGLSTLELRN